VRANFDYPGEGIEVADGANTVSILITTDQQHIDRRLVHRSSPSERAASFTTLLRLGLVTSASSHNILVAQTYRQRLSVCCRDVLRLQAHYIFNMPRKQQVIGRVKVF
jgi:hypothetical protein